MAMKIETRELQPILAETQSAEGYALGLNGVLKGYADEMKLSYLNSGTGATVKIGAGILLWQGKRIYTDSEGLSFDVPLQTASNQKYDIYLRIDMAQPDNVTAEYVATGAFPAGYVTDDLFNNFRNGVNYVLLGNFINTVTGIIQVTQTVGYAEIIIPPQTREVILWEGNAAEGATLELEDDPKNYAYLIMEMNFGQRIAIITALSGDYSVAYGSIYTMDDTKFVTNALTITRVTDLTWKLTFGRTIGHMFDGNHNAKSARGMVRLIGVGWRNF